MDEPNAWLEQARADFRAAERFIGADTTEWCQAIAKCQQCVEKAVKSLVSALHESGRIAGNFRPRHEVEPLLSILIHLPRSLKNRVVQNQIYSLFDQTTRGSIRALDALIPRLDPTRNTEYPFRTLQDEWTYPAAADAFSLQELQRFRSLAQRIIDGTERLVRSLRRQPG